MGVLSDAAEITGQVQQTLEKLHEFTTYQLPSGAVLRHQKALDEVRQHLSAARNAMAGISLALGKEHFV